MRISIIVAMDENNGIGYGNILPWVLPADLRRFKTLTIGHHLVMGRVTFQSIGKPLPGRVNMIVTRNLNFSAECCLITHSLDQAFEIARANNEKEVFIIGGGEIYAQALHLTDRIYLTRVHTETNADVYFPELDDSDWVEISSQYFPPDEDNRFPTTFKILEKRS